MKLTAFGEVRDYPDRLTVQQWLEMERIENQEVALVQVNGRDVLHGERSAAALRDGDRIQLLYFLGDS